MDSFSYSTFAYYFLSLLMEGAPFILLGTMLSGFIDVYMPSGMLERVLPKRKVPAILACGFLGIILPVCECAVVPVIRRLVAKGLPVSCAFTYMLAAPIVNPITILSTWSAFNEQQALYVTLSRIGIGYLVAVAVGLIVMWVPIEKVIREALLKRVSSAHEPTTPQLTASNEHSAFSIDPKATPSQERSVQMFTELPQLDLEKKGEGCCGHDHHEHDHACSHDHAHGDSCGHDHSHHHHGGNRVVAAMRSGMKDFVDVAVYFTIGVCLTALFNILQVDYYDTINSYAGDTYKGTAMLMVLAFVLSVCSTSDAFLAATLGTFSYASRMAFMVFGPMLDVKLLFLYQTVMKKRFMFILCVGLFFGVGAICIAWEQWEWLFEACKDLEGNLFGEGGAQ